MTFWDHLEELRGCILRSLAVAMVFALLAFGFKDELFAVVLGPKDPSVQLINTELTSQFMIHMMVSFYAGIIMAAPYIIYELYKFISPGLYQQEKRYAALCPACRKQDERMAGATQGITGLWHVCGNGGQDAQKDDPRP